MFDRNLKKVKKAAAFYWAHQDEIVNGHINEYVVIKDRQVCGYYKTEEEAFESMATEKLETFIVQKCQLPGTDIENYYNNAVTFA
jgi:hypothetical protein